MISIQIIHPLTCNTQLNNTVAAHFQSLFHQLVLLRYTPHGIFNLIGYQPVCHNYGRQKHQDYDYHQKNYFRNVSRFILRMKPFVYQLLLHARLLKTRELVVKHVYQLLVMGDKAHIARRYVNIGNLYIVDIQFFQHVPYRRFTVNEVLIKTVVYICQTCSRRVYTQLLLVYILVLQHPESRIVISFHCEQTAFAKLFDISQRRSAALVGYLYLIRVYGLTAVIYRSGMLAPVIQRLYDEIHLAFLKHLNSLFTLPHYEKIRDFQVFEHPIEHIYVISCRLTVVIYIFKRREIPVYNDSQRPLGRIWHITGISRPGSMCGTNGH